MNNRVRVLPVLLLLLVVLSVLVIPLRAQAGGSGGIDVSSARVCRNGVQFTGVATIPEVVNRNYNSLMLRGHVGIPTPLVATGNSHTYTAVNEVATFTIYYPTGTFTVGEAVTYSVLADDSSGYGGGQFAYVSDCLLPPGRDLLPIPKTAAVGRFTDNAETFWAPGQALTPPIVIEAGNTAWVLGIDASGQYYKIIWSSTYLWVPVGTMGPNFDNLWQGTSLPSGVVK